MPALSVTLALIIFAAGTIAGSLGALLGLGGGVFLVPFLNLVMGFPFTVAAAISLTTVIATSSTVSAGRAGKQLINMRLGMLLEVATAAGSFLGGVTAQFVSQSVLQRLFGLYQGVPLTERGLGDVLMPDKISIYMGEFLRGGYRGKELVEEIRLTIFHEIGHYFGLDDAALEELESS